MGLMLSFAEISTLPLTATAFRSRRRADFVEVPREVDFRLHQTRSEAICPQS